MSPKSDSKCGRTEINLCTQSTCFTDHISTTLALNTFFGYYVYWISCKSGEKCTKQCIISFTPSSKVRPSPYRAPRHSYMFNGVIWLSSISNFIKLITKYDKYTYKFISPSSKIRLSLRRFSSVFSQQFFVKNSYTEFDENPLNSYWY